MIISCACGAKLKIADEKLTDAGVRIKCPKCGTLHLAKRQAAPEPAAAVPAAAPQPAAPAMPWFAADTPAPSAGGNLVLVAHDSKVVAEMIDGVLKDGGFVTDYAPNGLEALRKATDLKPVAMVVDVGLTGIYGFELCERLKGDPSTRNIKIVLLSSVYGLTAYKRSPVTLYGADDYIEKHHIPDQLLAKVQRLLSGAPAAPAAREPEAPAAEKGGSLPPPLVSRKGVVQPAAPVPPPAAPAALTAPVMPEDVPVLPKPPVTLDTSRQRAEPPPAPVSSVPRTLAEAAAAAEDILPKTPVTLDGSRKTVAPPPAPPTAAKQEPAAPPPAPAAQNAPPKATAHIADASVKLDADFFEQEEYTAPEKPAVAAVDQAEIEKARRFARIIVSDIALYNQEAVDEGVKNGSFYELLKDDITEGRSVYENRVPEVIRMTRDYLQEAFDDFLASKKKLR